MKIQQGSGLTSMQWDDLLPGQFRKESSLPHLLHLVAMHYGRAADPICAATLGCLSWTGSICFNHGQLYQIFPVSLMLAGSFSNTDVNLIVLQHYCCHTYFIRLCHME